MENERGEMATYEEWKQAIVAKIREQCPYHLDFPEKGSNFMSIYSLMQDAELMSEVNKAAAKVIEREFGVEFDAIIGLDAAGLAQGLFLAQHFKVPYIPILPEGRLPKDSTLKIERDGVEYHILKGSLKKAARVLFVDDLCTTNER